MRKTLEDGTVEDINQRTVGGEAAAVAYMQTRRLQRQGHAGERITAIMSMMMIIIARGVGRDKVWSGMKTNERAARTIRCKQM